MIKLFIGIDTGVNTGIAVWDAVKKKFVSVDCTMIHRAMDTVKYYNDSNAIMVRVEDARLRKWIPPSAGREVLQGVGSVKRDARIWEEFLLDIACSFEMVAPKNNSTKLNSETFKNLTKWTQQTNEHARDAAMLVFGK